MFLFGPCFFSFVFFFPRGFIFQILIARANISIGTMSLMHPVDWMEVNLKQGYKQTLPSDEADLNGTEWFEHGDLSFLKTPLDRKSRISRIAEEDEEESDELYGAKTVVHTVGTELEFDIGLMMSFAKQQGLVLAAVKGLSPQAFLDESASTMRLLRGSGCGGADDEDEDEDSQDSGAINLVAQTPFVAVNDSDFAVPFSSIKKESIGSRRSLARSKRSLFNTAPSSEMEPGHRFSLDDDEEDETETVQVL